MNKQTYAKQLSFVHNMMVASIPLLRFAESQSEGALRDYFSHHIAEESGHAEILADDLKRLGVENIPLDGDAVEVTGAQYYLIAHVHPSALLGYMAALERESHTPEMIDAIEKSCGTEMKCIRVHTKLDAQHIQELDEQIAALPDNLQAIARNNEQYTLSKVTNCLNAMQRMEA